MTEAPRVRVKICGLTRAEDATAAERLGADYLGVVLSPGFGRSVPPQRAGAIVEGTNAKRVSVLVDASVDDAVEAARAIDAAVIQLHGSEDPGMVRELRERGAWTVWKSVRASTVEEVRDVVERYEGLLDGVLVEGFRPGVVGGGGATLAVPADAVRGAVPRDVDFILAGGLAPDRVADAIERFRPDVVDVSSGVEREPGRKDHGLVEAFIRGAGLAPSGALGHDPRRPPKGSRA